MFRQALSFVAIFAGLMLISGSLLADSMRCGTHLVQSGQRHGGGKYEVLKKCGQPTTRYGNVWIYEKGRSIKEVHFDDAGKILSIR